MFTSNASSALIIMTVLKIDLVSCVGDAGLVIMRFLHFLQATGAFLARSDSARGLAGAFLIHPQRGTQAWMARTLSQDPRDRVVAAVEGGMTCRAAIL